MQENHTHANKHNKHKVHLFAFSKTWQYIHTSGWSVNSVGRSHKFETSVAGVIVRGGHSHGSCRCKTRFENSTKSCLLRLSLEDFLHSFVLWKSWPFLQIPVFNNGLIWWRYLKIWCLGTSAAMHSHDFAHVGTGSVMAWLKRPSKLGLFQNLEPWNLR